MNKDSEIVEAQKAEDIVSVIRCKDCKHYHVTHWMPLPEPPEEAKNVSN